jgi:hypothetical protein
MERAIVVGCVAWAVATLAASFGSQDPAAAAASQAARAPGAKVTFERLGGETPAPRQSQRARLLSLAVERGETPTPFVAPGLFRATYTATLQLPARDRCRFRVEGKGSVKLTVNGEVALDGPLRAGKPLETAQPLRLKKGDNELVLVFESSAMGDGQFRLFWSGTGFGFEPIAPSASPSRPTTGTWRRASSVAKGCSCSPNDAVRGATRWRRGASASRRPVNSTLPGPT